MPRDEAPAAGTDHRRIRLDFAARGERQRRRLDLSELTVSEMAGDIDKGKKARDRKSVV